MYSETSMNPLYKRSNDQTRIFEFHTDRETYWLIDGLRRTLEPYGRLDEQEIKQLFTKLKDWAGYTEEKPP